MNGHKRFDDTNAGPEGGPGFPGRRDRHDLLGGAARGRVGGRGRGWDDAFGFGGGRHGAFAPGFGPPMFGRGPRRGRGDVRAAILALLAEKPMHGYQIITEAARSAVVASGHRAPARSTPPFRSWRTRDWSPRTRARAVGSSA